MSKAERIIQMGVQVTEGLGAGSQPEVGRAAAEEVIDEIRDHLAGAHMVFVTAGMGGGTGTGAAPVVARAARDMGILTVGVVTKPFQFEGQRRMRLADAGINELQKAVDTLIVIPNQNLFRVANEQTTFADAFAMADRVLYSGVACITDLMVKEGLINLDFADVRAVMREMGKAMMGTGEATGEKRALRAAEAAIANPLLDDVCMKGAQRPADLDHRRLRPDPVRSRRGGHPHPRGSRPGRQHDLRRDARRRARRHRARLGRRHRHRPAKSAASAAPCRWSRASPRRPSACATRLRQRQRAGWPSRQPPGPHRDADRDARRAAADLPAASSSPVTSRRPGPGAAAVHHDVKIRPAPPKPVLRRARCWSRAPPSPSQRCRRRPSSRRGPRSVVRAPRMPRVDELPIPASA